MNFQFTPEQELIKKAAREFAEEVVRPRVPEMEAGKYIFDDLFRLMSEVGFLGILVPRAYGGAELGTLGAVLVVEEISRISSALGTGLQVHCLGLLPVVKFGDQACKEKYLPGLATGKYIATGAITEAGGGSDPTTMTTTAVKDGDSWVVNGRKCFISLNKTANTAWLTTCTKEGKRREFTTFFVDKSMEGYNVGRMENKTGMHGLDNGELVFKNCRVPDANVLFGVGRGFPVALTSIGRMGRMGMACAALGVINASLEAAVKFAKERILYGRPIAYLQGVQFKIAEIAALLETSRLLVYKAAWLTDQDMPDVELAPKVSLAKHVATQSAIKATDLAAEILGGYGVIKEYHVERYLRDARMIWAAAGTGDIMQLNVAQEALKLR